MPEQPLTPTDPSFGAALSRERITQALTRGAARMMTELGFASLTEFTLRSGRRADLIGLDP